MAMNINHTMIFLMNRVSLSLILIIAVVAFGPSCHTATQAEKGKAESGGTQQLFNGKNLDGWYPFIEHRGKNQDVKKVFTVENGVIHVSGEEYGSIVTNEEYSDYRLIVEFRWGTKTYAPRVDNARDNGVLIHSTGEDGGYSGIWMHSIECQVIEGGTGDFLVVGDGSDRFALSSRVAPQKQNGTYRYQPDGDTATIHGGRINWLHRDPDWKDVKGFRGAKDVEKPTGEWNTMEIVAKGDKVSITVNGTLVNEAFNVVPSRGRIQLQSEGAEIFFRKVELQQLQ
jgi:hypothetical protein